MQITIKFKKVGFRPQQGFFNSCSKDIKEKSGFYSFYDSDLKGVRRFPMQDIQEVFESDENKEA